MALDNVHLRKLVELCDSHNYWLFFFFLFKCSWGTAEQLTRQHGGHSGGVGMLHPIGTSCRSTVSSLRFLPWDGARAAPSEPLGVLGHRCMPWCCSKPHGPTCSTGSRRGLSEMQTDWIRRVMRQTLN